MDGPHVSSLLNGNAARFSSTEELVRDWQNGDKSNGRRRENLDTTINQTIRDKRIADSLLEVVEVLGAVTCYTHLTIDDLLHPLVDVVRRVVSSERQVDDRAIVIATTNSRIAMENVGAIAVDSKLGEIFRERDNKVESRPIGTEEHMVTMMPVGTRDRILLMV